MSRRSANLDPEATMDEQYEVRPRADELTRHLQADQALDRAVARLRQTAPRDQARDGGWWRAELLAWCSAHAGEDTCLDYIRGLEAVLREMSDNEVLTLVDAPVVLVRHEAA
jgi:hypothetical protein